MGYFNIKQDIKIEQAGGFFCESCIACYPMEKQSLNRRYCQCCYNILKEERELKNLITQKPVEEMPPKGAVTPPVKEKGCNKQKVIANHVVVKVREKSITVKNSKKEPLENRVKRLTLQGRSSRTVMAMLEKDGITISHMTISRMQKKIRQGVLF